MRPSSSLSSRRPPTKPPSASKTLKSSNPTKNTTPKTSISRQSKKPPRLTDFTTKHPKPRLFSTQPKDFFSGNTFALNARKRDLDTESLFFLTQIEVLFEQEYERMRLLGLHPGLRVLDIGGGCGFFLEKMLQANEGTWQNRIWLLERDVELCKRAQNRVLKQHGDTVRILNADAIRQMSEIVSVIREEDNVQVDDGHRFDFIMMRFVVQHIPRHKVATLLRLIAKHLLRKDTGVLAIVEADDEYRDCLSPNVPTLQYLEDVYYEHSKERAHKAVDADFLLHHMKKLGYANVAIHAAATHSRVHPRGIEAYLPLLQPRLFKNLVPTHVSETRYNAIEKTFRSTFHNGNASAYTMSVIFVYSGRHSGNVARLESSDSSSSESSDQSDSDS